MKSPEEIQDFSFAWTVVLVAVLSFFFLSTYFIVSMCVYGHGRGFLPEGLEEDQRDAAKREYPDEQVHAVVGSQHRLAGNDPLHCAMRHLLSLPMPVAGTMKA